jgi:hypothetical protein
VRSSGPAADRPAPRARPALGLLLVLGLTAGACTSGGGEGGDPTPSGITGSLAPFAVGSWKAQNESGVGEVSAPDAVRDAEAFDVIVSLVGTYDRQIEAMKQANPDLVVLAHLVATIAWRTRAPGYYPKSWYLRDAQGAYVRTRGIWGDQYVMNPTNPRWVQDRVEACKEAIETSGYDGCAPDVLGTSPLDPDYVTGVPIDPSTGKPWTAEDWLRATSVLAAKIKQAVDPAVVVGNGLMSGVQYFDPQAPTSQILGAIDGGIAEAWLRPPWQPLTTYPPESVWKQNVDMLADAGTGERMMVLTKAWADGAQEDKEAWRRFAEASFLLGATGTTCLFAFSYGPGFDGPPGEPLAAELGSPLGAYEKIGGVYRRTFEHGRVLVNPTLGTYTVPLGGTYVLPDGTTASEVSLAPHDAVVVTSP